MDDMDAFERWWATASEQSKRVRRMLDALVGTELHRATGRVRFTNQGAFTDAERLRDPSHERYETELARKYRGEAGRAAA